MDRETRKANLKKLQLPGTDSKVQQRKTRQSAKTKGTTTISNYFATPEKISKTLHNQLETPSDPHYVTVEKLKAEPSSASSIASKPSRVKRTKLDAFVFKQHQAVPAAVNTVSHCANNDDDFDVPEKKPKKAPHISNAGSVQPKAKKLSKQTTIKSAFLRNEQLFAEIAAQHCAAENFDGDDIQLAIAISQSEAECKGIEINGDLDTNLNDDDGGGAEAAADKDAEIIRQKLERYGFRTAEKKDYHTFAAAFMPKPKSRRTRSKWANKFTALTLRDEQLQSKKLQQKIEALLNQQFRTKSLTDQEKTNWHFRLQSSLLRKCKKEMNGEILQLSKDHEKSHELYFVTELFEISKLPAGHLLKDWRAIQGRDLTPKKNDRTREMELKMRKIYKELEKYLETLNQANNSTVNKDKTKQEQTTEDENIEVIQDVTNIDSEKHQIKQDMMKSSHNKHKTDNGGQHNILNRGGNTANMEENYNVVSENESDSSASSSIYNKLKLIIPPIKSLDLMQVSGITSNSMPNVEDVYTVTHATEVDPTSVSTHNNPIQCTQNDCDQSAAASDLNLFNSSSKALDNEDISCPKQCSFTKTSDILELMEVPNVCKAIENTTSLSFLKDLGTKHNYNNSIEPLKYRDIVDVANNLHNENNDPISSREKSCITLSQDNLDVMKVPTNCIAVEKRGDNITSFSVVQLMQVSDNSMSTLTRQSPTTKDMDLSHTTCRPLRAETISNSSQMIRSNSPDLFADSDVEMEEDVTETTNQLNGFQYNSNLRNSEDVTTYEIYSSDEVKNSLSLASPDPLNHLREKNFNVIDLTQDDNDDVGVKPLTTLNQSKSILEVDLFADSPQQEDEEMAEDVNSNSQQSKYVQNGHGETFNFTLSAATTKKVSPKNVTERDSFRFSLSPEFPTTTSEYDDEDVVLREIAVNQTELSFLDFQGAKQLETCFHRETVAEPKEDLNKSEEDIASVHKESLPGNTTIFRELYDKYLGSSATTQNDTKSKANTSVVRRSFSQILPKVNTPQPLANETQFTRDFDITQHKRKSNLFLSKTPEKPRETRNYYKISKSQSFTEPNISIDLTQTETDADVTNEEEDDDCLVLSDDEINYSIWKSNKTKRLANNPEDSETDDGIEENIKSPKAFDNSPLTSLTSEEISLSRKRISVASQQSYSDFEINTAQSKNVRHKNSKLMEFINNGLSPSKQLALSQQSYSDFDAQTPRSNEQQDPNLDRSNFGILEEFSQTIEFSQNFCTPTNNLKNASFLESPAENSATMKSFNNCRKSLSKWTELVNNTSYESPLTNNFDEYDEFDCLIYGNRNKKSTSFEIPQGLDQLLTAEISFREYEQTNSSSNSNLMCSEVSINKAQDVYKSKTQTNAIDECIVQKQDMTINNKTYKIRSSNTPKPNYMLYTEAELLKELYNFGIKPLKCKQAVKMLEYIYLQTHPILVDEKVNDKPEHEMYVCDDYDLPTTSKTRSKVSTSTIQRISSSSQRNLVSRNDKVATSRISAIEDMANVGTKLNLKDASGIEMLRYAMDLKAELVDEQYILQTNVTKKTPQPLMPFHIAWYNLVCSNRNLHENILMYEPIDLQEIYLFLKGLGYRYDPKDLKQFFDQRCIIFRYDLAAAGGKDNNRHVRKTKKVSKKRRIV